MKRRGRTALLALVLLGCLIAGFSLSKFLPLSYILIFGSGAALMWVFAMIQTLVQAITADNMRGRVMSVYNVAFAAAWRRWAAFVGGIYEALFRSPVLHNGLLIGGGGLRVLLVNGGCPPRLRRKLLARSTSRMAAVRTRRTVRNGGSPIGGDKLSCQST